MSGRLRESPAVGRGPAALCLISVLFLMIGAPGVAAAEPAAGLPTGLDSLAAATLQRAMEYLEIEPRELGFDKLYAEDDTFRVSLVEELLSDPLKIPEWQARLVEDVRGSTRDPARLAGHLGAWVDAGDAPAGGSHWIGSTEGRAAARDQAVQAFVAAVEEAQAALDQALAALSLGERDQLLIMAPAFWGDWEEEADTRRKGRLHFEVGSAADTTLELDEDPVL
ncbi:MAG: hypothetical protein GF355_18000, partial [Candidatus Eisenbacteria bacterium]|nr:hypothetical protein [Candidatus Eisenbacteria bacterium]